MITDVSQDHATWFIEDLRNRILPLWLKHAPRESGYFQSQFDTSWGVKDERIGTLVSQTRLIYTMAAGYALSGDEAYRQAAQRGIEFLETHFRDTETFGYVHSCSPDGTVIDDTKQSYGHSFVIFAYANAAGYLGRAEYANKAKEVWEEYQQGFGKKGGGFYHVTSRSFEPDDGPLSQNPIMHLFEALLALGTNSGHEDALRDAATVAEFVTGRLIDGKTGFLPELFTRSWAPLDEEDGNRVDVGHAFEWSYLLSFAVQLGLPRRYLSFAHQLLDAGRTLGFDRKRGLVFSPASLDGERVKPTNTYWEQCEALRALLHFAAYRDRPELCGDFDILAKSVRAHYVDDENGGWYTSVTPKGTPLISDKGTAWKLDYHQTSMTLELKRIVEDLN